MSPNSPKPCDIVRHVEVVKLVKSRKVKKKVEKSENCPFEKKLEKFRKKLEKLTKK